MNSIVDNALCTGNASLDVASAVALDFAFTAALCSW